MDLDGPEIIDLTMLSSDSEEVDLEEIPPLVPNDSLRDFESDGMESLTREEENAIFLRVRLDKDMELYTSVFFRDARPKDDPSGPVTLDSFFDLIDRTLMPREGRIQFLQAEFWERHHRIRTPYDRREGKDLQPLITTRSSICSWGVFMSHLREYVDGHGTVDWHISIEASCV